MSNHPTSFFKKYPIKLCIVVMLMIIIAYFSGKNAARSDATKEYIYISTLENRWISEYCKINTCRENGKNFTLSYHQDTKEAKSMISAIFQLESFPYQEGRTDTFKKKKLAFEAWMTEENALNGRNQPVITVPEY